MFLEEVQDYCFSYKNNRLALQQHWTVFGHREKKTVPERDGTGREREKCLTGMPQTVPVFYRYF